jgi:23S rRNA (cytosine1962-C5)-methyltransferase
LDRPAPVAQWPRSAPDAWDEADARYESTGEQSGRWLAPRRALPEAWTVDVESLTLELRPAPSGQVGFFPEQVESWRWLRRQAVARPPGATVLNLFAHTGGSTLAAAATGCAVAHVDASRPAVAWARRNAAMNRLAEAQIRWLVDDALAFARREVRRGRTYDGVVLDPPSYGHGPSRTRWQLAAQLPLLLETCRRLLGGPDPFCLLTSHTPEYPAARLQWSLAEAFGKRPSEVDAGALVIEAEHGPALPAGDYARFPG